MCSKFINIYNMIFYSSVLFSTDADDIILITKRGPKKFPHKAKIFEILNKNKKIDSNNLIDD